MIGFSTILFLFSLLAVFKAPAKPFWFVAIAATEGGHWLVIVSLLTALLAWRWKHRWRPASWLALAASLLYLTPLLRAIPVARETGHPLEWGALFKGVKVSTTPPDTALYAMSETGRLEMSLYRPSTGVGPYPGVIVIHGGSWQSGTRMELSELNHYLADRGYLVASIDYRLAPRAKFPAQMDDVAHAIQYLKRNAKRLNLDPTRLVLLGRSAGGQIALSAAYRLHNPAIRGVIAFYSPSDLIWAYAFPTHPLIMNSRKILEEYLGGPPDKLPKVYEAASPLLAVDVRTPPTLMIHGQRDELVSPHHNDRLIEHLRAAGRPYVYLYLPWATHGCDAVFSGPSGQLSTNAVERFLAGVMSE